MSSNISRASASYKKQDGTLVLAKNQQTVSWTPVAPSNTAPADLTIAVSEITSMYDAFDAPSRIPQKGHLFQEELLTYLYSRPPANASQQRESLPQIRGSTIFRCGSL
jgi:hypothetical protein